MNKNYDDFSKMKPKEMSKAISDMTYTYINPETKLPTVVPPLHYEKLLNKVREEVIAEETKRIFLNTIYGQMKALKEEEPKYFQQALICLDLGLNPKDLRNDEVIALTLTNDSVEQSKEELKKNFHLLDKEIVDTFNNYKEDRALHSMIMDTDDDEKEEKTIHKYKGFEI